MSEVRFWRLLLLFIGLAFSVSCDSSNSTGLEPADLAALLVSPQRTTLTAGGSLQFSATPIDLAGHAMTGQTISWSTSNAAVATVSSNGLVTAVAPGSVIVIASSPTGGKVASAQLTVAPQPGSAPPPAVWSVIVTPPSGMLTVGGTLQFAASGYDVTGTELLGQAVSWTTSDSAVARVSATGLVTAVAPGAAIISATIGGKTAAGAVAINSVGGGGGGGGGQPNPTVNSVVVSPSSAAVVAGGWVQLNATPYDGSGNAMSGHPATWSTSNSAVASVSSTGLVTAVAAGSATITADIDGKTASSAITVSAQTSGGGGGGGGGGGSTPTVATVTVSPASGSLTVGGTQQLSAVARDGSGNTVSGLSVSWTTSNATVATVNSNGLVTAMAAGGATISATISGKTGSASMTVTAAAPPPPPNPNVRIYASHDFNDGSLGPFTGLATTTGTCNFNGIPGQCSNDVWARNGRVEIEYERLDLNSAGDRNRGIKWVPNDATENTPHGATIYVAGTWVIPSVTAAARTKINAAATALGLPYQTDAEQADLQRKLIYVNPGRSNHWFLKIQGLSLLFVPGVGGSPCSTTNNAQPLGVHKFTTAELLDKPQRIEIEVKRSSGVRTPDGEAKVWLNGVLVKHLTGFCTNEDTNTSWQVQIGQQVSYSTNVAELYSELRLLDDVVVANRRPF